MPTERMKLGSEAEEGVCRHLQALGYKILDRNWRRPWGELDVVAECHGTLHFIEVKASRTDAAGFSPYLRADARKMHRVFRTARSWLAAHRYGTDIEWQLDVASVIMAPEGVRIELFRI